MNNLADRLKRIVAKLPRELSFALGLFAATRLVLVIIGVVSRALLPTSPLVPTALHIGRSSLYTGHTWLDIWAVWDSVWYIQIAQQWYPPQLPPGQTNYGFFPLYPLLVRIVTPIAGSTLVAGIIVSNVCLIMACVFLYRLCMLSSDEQTSLRSVKYLFLFPSAFVLSGVFSEPLFLLLAILCFYHARKQNWLFCGAAGFLASLTRSNGVFLVLPIAYEYFKSKDFSFMKLRWDAVCVCLIPLGALLFAGYCYGMTGNAMAYSFAKKTGWYLMPSNPWTALCYNLHSHETTLKFNAVFSIAVILSLTLFVRKIGFSFWLYGMIAIVLPLVYGIPNPVKPNAMTSVYGVMRFSLEIFPLYILLAKLTVNDSIDRFLTAFLAILQGALMVYWSLGLSMVV